MQINFYMDKQDRDSFHEFVFDRGGYLIPEVWPERNVPCFSSHSDMPKGCHTLKLFREEVFSKSSFEDSDWITPYPSHGYFVHGPGIQYSPSWQDELGIHRGRLYMGLVGAFSFVKPGKPVADAYIRYADGYHRLENFYKTCCRYIRKSFRKDDAGFYHGIGSDEAALSGVAKLQF